MGVDEHRLSLMHMFRRAKISAFLTLAGVIPAAAVPLNPEQQTPAFRPPGNPR
jgi:hypothetical protein